MTLAGAQIQDRAGDDFVGANLAASSFVLAAAKFAFHADLRAPLAKPPHTRPVAPRLDAMPFGPFSTLAVFEERGLGGEKKGVVANRVRMKVLWAVYSRPKAQPPQNP